MKRIAILLTLLSGIAFGQVATRFDGVAQTTRSINGNTLLVPSPNASVTVCTYPATGGLPCTNKASVCPDSTGVGCTTGSPNNPITADAQGNFGFFALAGTYQYTVCPVSGVCRGPYYASLPAVVNGQAITPSSVTATDIISKNTPVFDVRGYASVQATIDAATAAGGGIVQIPASTTYSEAITLKSNVALKCTDRSSILTIPNATNAAVITLATSAQKTKVLNCTIDGNRSGQTGSGWNGIKAGPVDDLTIDNNEIKNTTGNGIRMDAATDGSTASTKITITNNWIHDIGTNGIWMLEKLNGLFIFRNTIENYGVVSPTNNAVSVSASANDRMYNFTVSYNIFDGTSTTLFAFEGVRLINTLDFSHNILKNGYNGISIQADRANISDNKFINGSQGTHRSGMELGLTNSVVHDNSIQNGALVLTNADVYTVTSSNDRIHHNIVTMAGADTFCYEIGGPTGPMNNVTVDHNFCDSSASTGTNTGAFFIGFYGSAGQMTNFGMYDNWGVGRGSGVGGNRGIRIATTAGSTKLDFKGNTFSAYNEGVLIPADANNDEVTFRENTLSGNGTAINNLSIGGTYHVDCNILATGTAAVACGGTPTAIAATSGTACSDLTIGFSGLGTSGGKTGFWRSSDGSMNWCVDGIVRAIFSRTAALTASPFSFGTMGTADSGTNYGAQGYPQWQYSYWDGAAAQTGTVSLTVTPGSGSNPLATINFVHVGSSGSARLAVTRLDVSTTSFFTGVASLTGGYKAGASGSTIADTRELVQSVHDCGTTTTCANTANLSEKVVRGTVALTSATPSTAVVTGMTAFGGTTAQFYSCWLTNETTAANGVKYARTSSSSITITGPNTVTDVISYLCIGH